MSKKNRIERIFPASTSILAELREFVAHEGARFGLDHLALHNLALAIDEAATNIIEHVLPRRASQITCACSDTPNHKQVVYEISWEAEEAYRPEPVPSSAEIRRRVEARTPGGLGVYLIHALVDEIEYDYRNGRCIIRLKKRKNV